MRSGSCIAIRLFDVGFDKIRREFCSVELVQEVNFVVVGPDLINLNEKRFVDESARRNTNQSINPAISAFHQIQDAQVLHCFVCLPPFFVLRILLLVFVIVFLSCFCFFFSCLAFFPQSLFVRGCRFVLSNSTAIGYFMVSKENANDITSVQFMKLFFSLDHLLTDIEDIEQARFFSFCRSSYHIYS